MTAGRAEKSLTDYPALRRKGTAAGRYFTLQTCAGRFACVPAVAVSIIYALGQARQFCVNYQFACLLPISEDEFIPIHVRKGGVCVLSQFIVHRTSCRGDERLRIAISGRYENASEPTFVERDYPFTQLKSMRRGFITENFPPREPVQEVFRVQ